MPFRGEITIQIVNQTGDHNHVENTDCYTDKIPDEILLVESLTMGDLRMDGVLENS